MLLPTVLCSYIHVPTDFEGQKTRSYYNWFIFCQQPEI